MPTDRMASNGRPVGLRSGNGRRRLTADDLRDIRGHRRLGVRAIEIARLWGISRSRVYQVLAAIHQQDTDRAAR